MEEQIAEKNALEIGNEGPIQAESERAAEEVALKIKSEDLVQDKPEPKKSKKWLAFLIIGIISLLSGALLIAWVFLVPGPEIATLSYPELPTKNQTDILYSPLTGLAVSDASEQKAPVYCIQTPNGVDGARPQVGLNQAGVVFEAIAEAGITRFAAIYQNPTSAVIGPIRSLRLYYLEWDTPFNCAIVHAGGADDAIAAVREGGYVDLTENYYYMYRGNAASRLWNNLFTTSAYLRQFSYDMGYSSANVNGFARMTPEEAKKNQIDNLVAEKLNITGPAKLNTSELIPKTSTIAFYFGDVSTFNVVYNYDLSSNKYKRSYGDGEPHYVYVCPDEDLGEVDPENVCNLAQMEPSVVIAMVVNEWKAEDNYHEDIAAIGSGAAYIFQNGTATKGTWSKDSWESQIKFFNEAGEEVKLVPGQAFVSAVPTYGGVEY